MKPFSPGLLAKRDIARLRSPAFGTGLAPTQTIPAPNHLDLRAEMLPASDQGVTSECTAYATAGWIEWWQWKYRGVYAQVDPHAIYRRAKQIDGIPDDTGSTLDAAVHAAVDLGLAPIDTNTLKVVSLDGVKRALHQHGVLLSGFTVTEGWRWATGGGWIKSGGDYDAVIGEHAVVLIGYSEVDNPPWFGIQNSWGESGYGWHGFVRLTPEQFNSQFYYGLVWEMKP